MGKIKTTLVSVDAGGGHNCELANGLKKYRDVTTIWMQKNPHGLDRLVHDAQYGFRRVPKRGDEIIIVACITFDYFKRYLKRIDIDIKEFLKGYKKVKIIVTDGRYALNPAYYNKQFKGYEIFLNACKTHWGAGIHYKEFYQPFDLSEYDMTKNKELTIAHSPFSEKKFNQKGTLQIRNIVRELGVKFDLITNVSWEESIRRKAKAHIFVDQISHFRDKILTSGGYVWSALGKSGIEAMHLGCMTLTRGKEHSGLIPTPPIVWVDKNLKQRLVEFIDDKQKIKNMAQLQKQWALTYATPDYAARNVLDLI